MVDAVAESPKALRGSDFFGSELSLASTTDSELTVVSASRPTSRPASRDPSPESVIEVPLPEDPDSVPVGNLIDLSDDAVSLPSPASSAIPSPPIPHPMRNGSGEESFEGVANGAQSGSLMDAAVESSSPSSFAPGHRKYPSASSAGKQLLMGGRDVGRESGSGYSGGSRRSSFNSDVEAMSVSDAELHSEISDIGSQVHKIQKQLAMMEESHFSSDEKHVRLKSDNAVLQERLHSLEEQAIAAEERWREKLKEEKARAKDALARQERERGLEAESWGLKAQLADTELHRLRDEADKRQAKLNAAEAEREELREALAEAQARASTAEEEAGRLGREAREARREAGAESEARAQEVAALREAQEELATRQRQSSVSERAEDLAAELRRMSEELRETKERNEELNAELLQVHVNAGQSLLSALASDGPSLAAEMDGKDNSELLNALKEQEVCNQKLRTYIDGILMRVIEKYPEILEVSSGQ